MSWFQGLRLSADFSAPAQAGVLLLVVATCVLLGFETRGHRERRIWLFVSGAVGAIFLAGAVLRPSRLQSEGRKVPGLVVVLTDSSHRLDLPVSEGTTRSDVAARTIATLKSQWSESRVEVRKFGAALYGDDIPNDADPHRSDLLAALRGLAGFEGERPALIVALSDGRFFRPVEAAGEDWSKTLLSLAAGLPVDTVALVDETPRDRSIRRVGVTGSAIAHQPFNLALEVGCEPKESCAKVEVVVRELLEGLDPVELARGKADGSDGIAQLELQVILEQAGGRIIEVELLSDQEDDISENDKRILPIQVRRDRLRMLHVAGRPTYDVRALRMFLKSDESIDLVSFFILRTMEDQVDARPDEMALIPFPVDELFSEHLRSFDAVILQDINAREYELDRHFRSIADYVMKGGGLILVGGPTGFSSGGYAGSAVEDVLPVELPKGGEVVSTKSFVPNYTRQGMAAPMLAGLRSSMSGELPEMNGTNILGRPRAGAVVLWEHPTLEQAGVSGGDRMPVLALREVGDGRSIAISVDGTHRLRFGEAGSRSGGGAYADLWGGLLGWLMRDPRYEAAQVRLMGDCIAGRDQILRVDSIAAADVPVEVKLERLGSGKAEVTTLSASGSTKDGGRRFVAPGLIAGGYAASVKVGDAPPTRFVFSCEAGGDSWSDSRPDRERLRRIAQETGGRFVDARDVSELEPPRSTFVSASKKSQPLISAWIWATLAALSMCAHWVLRRAVGMA